MIEQANGNIFAMYGNDGSLPIFLKNMMTAADSDYMPSVFLQKLQQVFVFQFPPPYWNSVTRVTRVVKKNLDDTKF